MQQSMRVPLLSFVLSCLLASVGCGGARPDPAVSVLRNTDTTIAANAVVSHPVPVKVDFETQLRPILHARCMPCHFAGGKMYEKLPFDRAGTIKELGSKLFSRIKDEKEQALFREFLAQ